ncbi:hypothetical protein DL770_009189 [Monosporascus sp. CRB-9-2]|nr:hypothetical protein DL770_009189 [Monosporascus sp. CRB-9-2]
MAAVIGDFVSDHSRFHHSIISPSGLPREHSHSRESYRSESRNRPREVPSQKARSPTPPSHYRQPMPSATPSKRPWESTVAGSDQKPVSPGSGTSRLPSPPDSASEPASAAQNAKSPPSGYMASETTPAASVPTPTPTQHHPSPESEAYRSSVSESIPYNASTPQCHTIVVRDLAHIQSLARADLMNGGNGPGILNDTPLQAMKYEISGMPIGDIIEMVAALLTKITTTNDLQHDALHRNAAHQHAAASHNNDGTSMSPLSSSVLAFHGKNVPAITILSYLSRIHKYCPTTYEVFLSLLVYFDRMTERINNLVMEAEEARRQAQLAQTISPGLRPSSKGDTDLQSEQGDSDTDPDLLGDSGAQKGVANRSGVKGTSTPPVLPASPATYFVADSFNIHRLIIAGVTCASKFFSDVFYTNSRYAKVGGLPLAELNHLELQFLILNDFRLAVPVEDLEAYATMLVEFYAREVLAPRPQPTGNAE